MVAVFMNLSQICMFLNATINNHKSLIMHLCPDHLYFYSLFQHELGNWTFPEKQIGCGA